MTVRKTFQWSVVLVAIIATGGWYALDYLRSHKDRIVLAEIRKAIARMVPDWGVSIDDARLELRGRIKLTNVTMQPAGETEPLLVIPECLVTVDRDLLFDQQQVQVRSVRVIKPVVVVSRNAEGSWNWQGLSRPTTSDQTPEIRIDQGDVVVRLAASNGLPATEIVNRHVNMTFVPSGRKRYRIEGETQIDDTGALAFGGEVDLNNGAWRLAGRADDVEMSPELLEKAAAIAPQVQEKVAALSKQRPTTGEQAIVPGIPQRPPHPLEGPPIQTASLEQSTPTGQLRLPTLGLSANVSVDFDLASDGKQQTPRYRVLAKVTGGTLSEPLSPVPLSNLQGELLLENDRVVVHQFSASNGASDLSISGEMREQDGRSLRNFEVAVTNLLIDPEVRQLLPGNSARRLFDRIQPEGLFTIRGAYFSNGVDPPQIRLDEFRALDCSMRFVLFPYPIIGIQGTITQEDDVLTLDLQGLASGKTVFIDGTITNAGPAGSAQIGVQANDVPVDQTFVDALVGPKLQPVRRAVELLNVTGQSDVKAIFVRDAGLNQPTLMGLDVELRQGSFDFEKFPYLVTDFAGHLKYDPWREKVWKFTKLRGKHGTTELTGSGTFALSQPGEGRLDLTVNAKNLAVDKDLHRATTTASSSLHEVWLQLNPAPQTVCQCEEIHVGWTPGQPPEVDLPSIRVRDGALTLRAFPLPLHNVDSDVQWLDNRLTFKHFTARHNETLITIAGSDQSKDAYFEVMPVDSKERWQLQLEDVHVDNLDPGPEFRRALPGEAAAAFDKIDPRGPLIADFAVNMKGFPDARGGPETVTAEWWSRTEFNNDRLSVGLDLTNVTGVVESTNEYNGVQVTSEGRLELQTARTLDMTLTNISAPFVVEGGRVIVGSEAMLVNSRPGSPEPQVPTSEQLSATIYGGSLLINTDARLHPTDAEQSIYRSRVRFKDIDLRQWAQEWKITGTDVNGLAYGQLNLYGHGTSELNLRGEDCWMQVPDARLGELPILAQMLTQMPMSQSRNRNPSAFDHAYLSFDIHDGYFDFGPKRGRRPDDDRKILLGGAINMVGSGYVPFSPQRDPRMNLDFYSKTDQRNPLVSIPLVSTFVKPLSDNWIHVIVTGTPSKPQIRTLPEVPLDNAFREFFKGIENGLMPRPR